MYKNYRIEGMYGLTGSATLLGHYKTMTHNLVLYPLKHVTYYGPG